MRISDWSSDVCSSDLPPVWGVRARTGFSTFSFLAEPQKEAATMRPAPMFALAFGLLLAPGSAIAITLPDCAALAAWTEGTDLREYQVLNPSTTLGFPTDRKSTRLNSSH